MPLSKIQTGMRDNITNSELPDIQASDLNVTTQGVGLSGWEHIETRVAKSDGDANFENGNGNANQDTGASTIAINLSTLKTRYSCYKIYFQLSHTGSSTQNLLFDTMRMDQTSTNNGTWYGAATLQDHTGHASSLTRNAGTTIKLVNNMWARGAAASNYRGGVFGEMTLYGFHPEVTVNMDGFDHRTHSQTTSNASEVNSTGYRTYMKWNCHTYNISGSIYQGMYGTARQNQTFRVTQTGSASDSFGGFMLMSNTTISGSNYKFAEGSYFSIYGLRMPTGD